MERGNWHGTTDLPCTKVTPEMPILSAFPAFRPLFKLLFAKLLCGVFRWFCW